MSRLDARVGHANGGSRDIGDAVVRAPVADGDAVLLFDREGRLAAASAAADRLLGASVVGAWRQLTFLASDGDELPDTERPSRQVLRRGRIPPPTGVGVRLPGRETLWVEVIAQPVVDAAGEITGVVVHAHECAQPSRPTARRADPRIVPLADLPGRLAQGIALVSSLREGMPMLHNQQVADLAAAIADQLDREPGLTRRSYLAGWLHDVGKVAIPDSVLAKPGALTAEEWAVMRRHCEVGEQLVLAIPGLESAGPAVRHHHERWDGTGYPDGIAGETIELEARIVAVADAFSALTQNRVYSRATSREMAIAELEASANTHFDPQVVAAAVAVLERGGASRE